MDWNDVRYFLALARCGSVRGAGTTLGVSHSTVARRVEALEERLCTRLFNRTRDGYTLTDAGHRILPGAERVEQELADLERGIAGADERLAGPVSITCCDNFVADLVLEELRTFTERFPRIELVFTTDSRAFDLAKGEADVAIRTLPAGNQPPVHLIGQRLAPVTMANYVARAHRERLCANGKHARWLSFSPRAIQQRFVHESSYPDVPLWGAFSCIELMVSAGKKGLGWLMLPTYVGDTVEGLERLPEADTRHVAELWMLSHPDLRTNARLAALRQALARVFEERRALFEGRSV